MLAAKQELVDAAKRQLTANTEHLHKARRRGLQGDLPSPLPPSNPPLNGLQRVQLRLPDSSGAATLLCARQLPDLTLVPHHPLAVASTAAAAARGNSN